MKPLFLPAVILLSLGLIGSPSARSVEPEKAKGAVAKTPDDAQDFVFLTEVRPLLIRVHVRLDGKTLREAGDELFLYVFRYLDRDNDGFLNKAEENGAPTLDQILNGGVSVGLGGGGGGGKGRPAQTEPVAPTLADLDTNKDGKVSADELAAYYRKSGFVSFQFQLEQTRAGGFNIATILGGGAANRPLRQAR